MQRLLKTMLVDTPLIKNLDNPDYMAVLLNGKADLEELFAHMDPISLASDSESQSGIDRVLPGFRKIIRLTALPEHLMRLAANGNELQTVRPN